MPLPRQSYATESSSQRSSVSAQAYPPPGMLAYAAQLVNLQSKEAALEHVLPYITTRKHCCMRAFLIPSRHAELTA